MKSHHTRNVFLAFFGVILVLLIAMAFSDLSMVSSYAVPGVAVAMSMVVVGNIDDVTDRDTHGSAISYIVFLVAVDQLDRSVAFPQPNANREVAPMTLKAGEVPHYIEAHTIPTLSSSTEKGDITTTGSNNFVIIAGGDRDQIFNFVEQYAGGKFILLYKHVKESQWYILGELERPIILNNTETHDDADGRYTQLTFVRNSVDLPLKYLGNPSVIGATEVATAATSIAVATGSNNYSVIDGATAEVEITGVSGLTSADKGRYINLIGAGTTKAKKVVGNSTFILADGAAWNALAGHSLTLRVLDATTLVEVARS